MRPLCRALILVLLLGLAAGAHAQDGYQTPPPELARLVDAPATPVLSLSPDRAHYALMTPSELPTIADLAQEELRLAGLRINPRTNAPSRSGYYTALSLHRLDDAAERPVTGLPADARIGEVRWAPGGSALAFTLERDDRLELWVADVATGAARRLFDGALNGVAGASYAWHPDGDRLLARRIPAARGAAPVRPAAPASPVIQESAGKAAPARTYQDLLETPYDEALFEHLLTSEIVLVGLDGRVQTVAPAGLYTRLDPAPGGGYVLVEERKRPFSYLVPWSRFPNTITVRALPGGEVAYTVAALPLQENVPTGFGSVPTGPRSVDWRADAPSTLVWVEAADGGDARAEAAVRDRVMMHAVPTRSAPLVLAELPMRYAGLQWAPEGRYVLVNASWWATRQARTYLVDPDDPAAARLLFDYSSEDRYNHPGTPMTTPTPRGTQVLLTDDDGEVLYLRSEGASPEGNRPVVRRLHLATGRADTLFQSAPPVYEEPVTLLDSRTLLTRRETVAEPPNYYVRDLAQGTTRALTAFAHPFPELKDVQKEFVQYERADGLPLSATVYLPAGYDARRDGPLPTFVWAYPREYKSLDAAGQVTDSPYRFNRVSYWGPVAFVTRGYAVVDNASMPIVGEGAAEPNDSFVRQLVQNAEAVIAMGREKGFLDPQRVAVGGHSYGAFMTANLLAHSDLFRAGIARSGAYNRTLTPFGFQSEERTYWEAPDVYNTMSPFMNAEKVNEPILLIHGMADNNSGTFPIQSERFYAALKGLGQTARLVMLPHESHGYRARESLLHMLWEMDRWLETYVKTPPDAAGTGGG